MARIVIISSYMEALNHAVDGDWLHFYLPPYTGEKKTTWTLLGSNLGRLRGKRPLYPLLLGSRARIKLDTLASLRNVFELSWKDLDEWFYHETKQAAT